MQYTPDAYELQANPQLSSVIKATTLKGAEFSMIYCQMLDESGKLVNWEEVHAGYYKQIKEDSPPKELQSDFTKTVMRIHASGKPVHRET